jgi:hypothetical protein
MTYYTTKPITTNCTVTVVFAPATYTVTVSAGTGGTISPSGAVSVPAGATTVFTVTPNTGYSVSSLGGTCGSNTLSGGGPFGGTYITKFVTENCTITATFIPSTYITASAGTGGTISPSGTVWVTVGATPWAPWFTVTPNAGYGISSVGGTCGGTLNGNTYYTKPMTVGTICTVTASFIKI